MSRARCPQASTTGSFVPPVNAPCLHSRLERGNGEADVGLALLEAGLAWHFKRYAAEQAAPQRQRYAAAEQRARDDGIGMWREAGLVEPWRFRAQQRRGLAP